MLQRIGLLIADDEPENGALITGAARRRSVGYTMTTRVVDRWERVMADLDAALGEQARHELQARGAAMDDREATALARAAAARVLDLWSSPGAPEAAG
jgi:hypothetical protein